jgi:SAM-dependent methyltransferase
MTPEAIDEMNAAEDRHWWYAGLRDLLSRLLTSSRASIAERPTVLDVGCGTGANLRLLDACLRPAYLGGFDVRPECVAHARRKCAAADVYQGDLRRPELHRSMYDLVLCCDVISDAGLAESFAGLKQIADRLAPGGRMVLHAPACRWLSSDHDAAVGTVERFARRDLERLIHELGLEVEFISYRMAVLLPLVAAMRFGRRIVRRAEPTCRAHSDVRSNHFGANLWRAVVAGENAALCRGLRWPLGSSLVAVARRSQRA